MHVNIVVLLQMLHLVDSERHEFVEVQIIDDVMVPELAERIQKEERGSSSFSPGLLLAWNLASTPH